MKTGVVLFIEWDVAMPKTSLLACRNAWPFSKYQEKAVRAVRRQRHGIND